MHMKTSQPPQHTHTNMLKTLEPPIYYCGEYLLCVGLAEQQQTAKTTSIWPHTGTLVPEHNTTHTLQYNSTAVKSFAKLNVHIKTLTSLCYNKACCLQNTSSTISSILC